MRRRYIGLIVLSLIAPLGYAGDVVVGSFNIEWFGHGNKPRTDEQITILADFIKALEIDLLACQEIHPYGDTSGNGVADLDDLMHELGKTYSVWYGNTGRSQRLAFIWKNDRLELTDVGELRGVDREDVPGTNRESFPRRPITAHARSLDGGLDFRIVTAHLYWSDDRARRHEASQLSEWSEEYLASGSDETIVVIGDFNTKPLGAGEHGNSETIIALEAGGFLTCISDEHHEWTTPESEERYDHALLSQHALDTVFLHGSWDVRREVADTYPSEYSRDISNHVPVCVSLSDEPDGSSVTGDWRGD